MNGPADWTVLADLAPKVRSAFDPECLAAYDARMRSRILSALRRVLFHLQPRTVDLDQGVMESVFGSFGPDHAFNAFTPDWGLRLTKRQATQGLTSLLNRGEAQSTCRSHPRIPRSLAGSEPAR